MTVTILPGDCRDVLATLPAGTFQTCVTSPPYYGLRDYGHAAQIGLEPTPDEYVAQMVAVFREVRRVLRDDGTLWLNIGDSYANASSGGTSNGSSSTLGPKRDGLPGNKAWKVEHGARAMPAGYKHKDLLGIPWMLVFALRADGWYLRSEIIWHKPNPMPESVRDRPTKAHEQVFLLTKAPRYFYDADAISEPAEYPGDDPHNRTDTRKDADPMCADGGSRARTGNPSGATRNARTVWTIATQPYSGAHFATMPPDLAERCIRAGTSERGQCPHCCATWARQVERTAGEHEATERPKQTAGMHSRTSTLSLSGNGSAEWAKRGSKSKCTGWAPSCECDQHPPSPQHVLDPFGGAGTTGLVADRLQRHATLIELNPTYATLAQDRVRDDAPLLGNIA